jgi:anaerobic ribonucleoside-triphosphate reductase activating protein
MAHAPHEDFAATTLKVYGTVTDSIVDGPGLRYAIFTQGCHHHCPGCHNPESQPFDGGTEYTLAALLEDIEANKLIDKVTLTGGDPFDQPHPCAVLAEELKRRGYNVWCYTGALYEDLLEQNKTNEDVHRLLNSIDVLVDGPFIEARKSLSLHWCGSANQRLIDMPSTREKGYVVLWADTPFGFEIPANW